MTLLFSSFLFIISKFYISTIIVKIQLNDNKFKNINLLFTTQYKLFTYQVMSCHIHDCYSVDARRWVCCEASQQSNLLPRRFFPTEQMLTEQLNTGVQETKVLNIYRNYLFTTQENQLLAFDSFRVITSFEKLPNFRCRRWYFHSLISRNSIQTHF